MPYHLAKKGNKWAVEKLGGGVVPGGTHPTREQAVKHLQALEINVHDAKSKDTGTSVPNAVMLTGPGGLMNTPGLGTKPKLNRFKRKGGPGSGIVGHFTPHKNHPTEVPPPNPNKVYPMTLASNPVHRGAGTTTAPKTTRFTHARVVGQPKHTSTNFLSKHPFGVKRRQKTLSAELMVIKQADGSYRWIAISSNAYQDREGEIVKYKALNDDCDRCDATGDYGPLRWWHLFITKEGELADDPEGHSLSELRNGVDLGDCDFNCMVGRMLVESGTFRTKEIGGAVASRAGNFEMSLGFLPTKESGGEYDAIQKLERSLVPSELGVASNPFTTLVVTKESIDMADIKTKWAAVVNAVFGGDETKAQQFVQTVEQKDKAIAAAGVKFKAASTAEEERSEGEDKKSAEVEEKAHDEVPEAKPESAEAEAGEESTAPTMADLEQALKELGDYIIEAVCQHSDGMVTESLKSYHDHMGKLMEGALAPRMKEQKETLASLDARLKTLEGEQPVASKNRFRPSQSPETITTKPEFKEAPQPGAPITLAGADELTQKMIANLFAPGTLPHQQ